MGEMFALKAIELAAYYMLCTSAHTIEHVMLWETSMKIWHMVPALL